MSAGLAAATRISTEILRDLADSLRRRRPHLAEGRDEVRVRHPGAEIGPPLTLQLRRHERLALTRAELPPGRARPILDVELDLLSQSAVDHGADLEIFRDGPVDRGPVHRAAQ